MKIVKTLLKLTSLQRFSEAKIAIRGCQVTIKVFSAGNNKFENKGKFVFSLPNFSLKISKMKKV